MQRSRHLGVILLAFCLGFLAGSIATALTGSTLALLVVTGLVVYGVIAYGERQHVSRLIRR